MNEPDTKSEALETKRRGMGKARLKPRHLSQIVKQVIVDSFHARQSSEDVAEELGLPVRTVTDVLLLHELRKPVASAVGPLLIQRRTA